MHNGHCLFISFTAHYVYPKLKITRGAAPFLVKFELKRVVCIEIYIVRQNTQFNKAF